MGVRRERLAELVWPFDDRQRPPVPAGLPCSLHEDRPTQLRTDGVRVGRPVEPQAPRRQVGNARVPPRQFRRPEVFLGRVQQCDAFLAKRVVTVVVARKRTDASRRHDRGLGLPNTPAAEISVEAKIVVGIPLRRGQDPQPVFDLQQLCGTDAGRMELHVRPRSQRPRLRCMATMLLPSTRSSTSWKRGRLRFFSRISATRRVHSSPRSSFW